MNSSSTYFARSPRPPTNEAKGPYPMATPLVIVPEYEDTAALAAGFGHRCDRRAVSNIHLGLSTAQT